MNGLKIVMGSGDPKQAAFAAKILPVRANGNLLLCTLLLGMRFREGHFHLFSPFVFMFALCCSPLLLAAQPTNKTHGRTTNKGNVAVNALLSILMADLTSGLVGFLVSTFVIVIFGEICPQSLCSRYPLEIGSASIPVVKVFLVRGHTRKRGGGGGGGGGRERGSLSPALQALCRPFLSGLCRDPGNTLTVQNPPPPTKHT